MTKKNKKEKKVTDQPIDEFAAENPTIPEGVIEDEVPASPPPPPVFVYAVAMLESGELKIITELPFEMRRQALPSDVQMTASYINSQIKSGNVQF